MARIAAKQGLDHVHDLLAGLRVHPVFTAHPTEARRRAVVASLRRLSGLLTEIDDQRSGAGQQAEMRRRLHEEVDLLWRTAQLRVAGMTPANEVRTVMTAFDETLFRLVPAVYRAMDHVLLGPDGARPRRRCPRSCGVAPSISAAGDGDATVTAAVTREAAPASRPITRCARWRPRGRGRGFGCWCGRSGG